MPDRPLPRPVDLAPRQHVLRDARSRIEALFETSPSATTSVPQTSDLDLWRNRRLEPGYAMAFFDSLAVKIRERGLLCAKRIHLALGVQDDGGKDILGFWIGDVHAGSFWPPAMKELRARGVQRIDMAATEDDTAWPGIRANFPASRVFWSVKYLVQASVSYLPPAERTHTASSLLDFFASPAAELTLYGLLSLAPVKANPVFANYWRQHWELAAPVLSLPVATRSVFCKTSAAESVIEKLRRRGISKRNTFTCADAAIRELVFVLQDAGASWKVSPQKWAAVRMERLCETGNHPAKPLRLATR